MPLSQKLQLLGLVNPSHVSVTTNDLLVILDYPKVKIFNRAYQQCLHHFQPGPDLHSIPSCLAVDKNLIAVGYDDKEKISLHNLNGCLIKVLSAPMMGEHLSIHRQQFVYISRDKKKLQAVDINGKSIFSSDIHGNPSDSQAHGLCHDSEGDIYVAVHAGRLKEGEIQHFSPDGTYTGCVHRVRGYPAGIAFTPASDLAIAAERSVKIYPSGPTIHRQNALRK
ncbi:uncharacterized protein LOC119730592 [Patiria miniata]|uniref:Uncharacterized protein n=1 Tax=Patiria miniata TaxID=46514 RepID=A0A914A6L0_PATMI|nr:uncharacterized protein LOC119730592 [Patiria miniata]